MDPIVAPESKPSVEGNNEEREPSLPRVKHSQPETQSESYDNHDFPWMNKDRLIPPLSSVFPVVRDMDTVQQSRFGHLGRDEAYCSRSFKALGRM